MPTDLLHPTSILEHASLRCQEHVCTIITESCRKLQELASECLPAERAWDIQQAGYQLQTQYNSLQEYCELNWVEELRSTSQYSFTELLGNFLWLHSGDANSGPKLMHATND